VPVELRDEIARIAHERSSTMVEVVREAFHRLAQDTWWEGVHDALDEMTDPDLDGYQREAEGLGGSSADGLRAD
jgi:hypothetical protein